jgi:hypothetical protein
MAKSYKEFDIRRPGFADGIKVRVYKTPASMRKGYREEWSRFNGRKRNTEDLFDAVGIFYSPCHMISDLIEGRFTGDVYGIMFLSEPFITPEVIIHECVHASMQHERDIERFGMDYSNRTDTTHEERFAYYMGWLAAELLRILKKAGYLRHSP